MRKTLQVVGVLVIALVLLFASGVARAQTDNSAPAVNTDNSWPFIQGASGSKQSAMYAHQVTANDYDFGGQTISGSQRAPALFSLVPSTGAVSATSFTGTAASTSNFDAFGAIMPMANGNYAWVGTKFLAGDTTSYGMVFIRQSSGSSVGWNHTSWGSTDHFVRFNDAIQITGGTHNGAILVVGFNNQTNAEGDIAFRRVVSSPPDVTSQASALLGQAGVEEEAFSIIQLTDSTFAIGGRQDDGAGGYDFYLELVDASGNEVTGFTLSGTTEDGTADAIYDLVLDGNGDIWAFGTTGTIGSEKGYAAKFDPATGALVTGYEYATTATGIFFRAAALQSNGDFAVTGSSGDDLYLTSLQDATGSIAVDWSNTYDSGRTGDVGKFITALTSDTLLVAGEADDAGASTDAVFWLFDPPPATVYPAAPTLNSPADAATGIDFSTGTTLDWADGGTGGGEDATVSVDVYFENANPPTTKVVDAADPGTTTTYSTGALSAGTTYYWKAVARDADGDTTASAIRSFSTLSSALFVTLNSDVNATYYDNNNKAGFDPTASDGYDSNDVPEPPALGSNYIRTYFYESGNTGYQQELTEDYRDLDNMNLVDSTGVYTIITNTDQPDSVHFTVDVSTNNSDSFPVVFWNGSDFQNMLGAADASNLYAYLADTTGSGVAADTFAVLIGDTTAPSVTAFYPLPDSSTEWSRSSQDTIKILADNSNPVRRAYVAFSPSDDSNSPRQNWTNLTSNLMAVNAVDDPTDGIANDTLKLAWAPYVDDNALFSSPSDVFPDAQLRFITEDWAGNIDTSYVNFAIVPDRFSYTGDYDAGWHLLSLPLEPDDALPSAVFTTATGDNNGIAGDFSMFEYSTSAGYAQPTDLAIGKGYWIVLDAANTAAATNAGLGTVDGTIAGATERVSISLDTDSWNLVGITTRTADLDSGGVQADDWEFSDDSGTTWYSWDTAVTNTWINASSVMTYDNSAGDYAAAVTPATDTLQSGVGYTLQVGTVVSGTLLMSTRRDSVMLDKWNPAPSGKKDNNRNTDDVDDFDGTWFVPINIAIGDYSNDLSGFGCNAAATDGYDPVYDAVNPPLPPSGHYVRAVMDRQSWNAPFGRYFVRDIRAPFDQSATSASWDYKVYSSETGTVSMSFDISGLEQYGVPEGFAATATVGDQVFDLVESQTITFAYSGGQTNVHIEATLSTTGVGEDTNALPTVYSIEKAYPNPFNPTTVVRVGLPKAANLDVVVYNVLGKEVARLATGRYAAGYHSLVFDAHTMASGVYFVRATVPGKLNQVRKVVLVR